MLTDSIAERLGSDLKGLVCTVCTICAIGSDAEGDGRRFVMLFLLLIVNADHNTGQVGVEQRIRNFLNCRSPADCSVGIQPSADPRHHAVLHNIVCVRP
jgi:hypothetical protein